MLRDANLCAEKWHNDDFNLKNTAEELKGSLAQCGLVNSELCLTYLADRSDENGLTIQSALDQL